MCVCVVKLDAYFSAKNPNRLFFFKPPSPPPTPSPPRSSHSLLPRRRRLRRPSLEEPYVDRLPPQAKLLHRPRPLLLEVEELGGEAVAHLEAVGGRREAGEDEREDGAEGGGGGEGTLGSGGGEAEVDAG